MSTGYQVGPDTVVSIEYSVFDAENDPVMAGASCLEFVFGRGQLLPAVERTLDGRWPGERCTAHLEPRDAYGRRDPRAILEVDRSEFPENVEPGDRFEVENRAGALLVLRVLDVGPETVTLDLNHPLAGQKLRIDLHIVGVRPATASEIEAAEQALEGAEEEVGVGGAHPPQAPVIPLESLLRGRGRRYEKGPAGKSSASLDPGDIDEH